MHVKQVHPLGDACETGASMCLLGDACETGASMCLLGDSCETGASMCILAVACETAASMCLLGDACETAGNGMLCLFEVFSNFKHISARCRRFCDNTRFSIQMHEEATLLSNPPLNFQFTNTMSSTNCITT